MAIMFNFCCFVFSAIQAVGAIFALVDRNHWRKAMIANPSSPQPANTEFHLVIIVLLASGALAAAGLGGYLIGHPIQPEIKTVVQTVEKIVPCPAIKTGPATAKAGKGGTATAHSGNADTYNTNPVPPKNP